MSTQSSLERLSPRLFGTVLHHLTEITGSRGVVNFADISVIERFVKNLACTSKKMTFLVNHHRTTKILLNALSKRFGFSCEDSAVMLETVGARQFLWRYIRRNGDDRNYHLIQEIRELATQILVDVNDTSLVYDFEDAREGWPTPDTTSFQTRQGFAFILGQDQLATPFGCIQIYGSGGSVKYDDESVAEVIIRRLNAEFQGLNCESWNEKGPFYEIPIKANSGTFRQISHKDLIKISKRRLKTRVGSQNVISGGNYSTYHIHEVNGKKTPPVIEYTDPASYRSSRLIIKIWEMLEVERRGLAAVTRSPETLETTNQPNFTNVSDVASWAIPIIEQLLNQQTIQNEYGLIKKLDLDRYWDGRTIEILNKAAQSFLTEDVTVRAVGKGIELRFKPGWTPCELTTLRNAYDQVLAKIGENWRRTELRHFPTLDQIRSEEDYILFMKNELSFPEENCFIAFLAKRLNLFMPFTTYYEKGYYIWIKKDLLDETLKILNIKDTHE